MLVIEKSPPVNCESLDKFRLIRNISDLSRLIRIDSKIIEDCILYPKYHEFPIRKKKSGIRIIHSSARPLKDVQKKLSLFFSKLYFPIVPQSVHGFVKCEKNKKRNILTNAVKHIGQNHLLNLDIADFFPSISADIVKESILSFPNILMNDEAASIISLLATYHWK